MPTTIEADCRAMARQFPTPIVLAGVRLAECGQISWPDLYDIYREALTAALKEVSAPGYTE